jgi:hypothetical protein
MNKELIIEYFNDKYIDKHHISNIHTIDYIKKRFDKDQINQESIFYKTAIENGYVVIDMINITWEGCSMVKKTKTWKYYKKRNWSLNLDSFNKWLGNRRSSMIESIIQKNKQNFVSI